MADPRRTPRAHTNADRAYELQPVRSLAWRVGCATLWAVLAATAGAGMTAWLLKPQGEASCPVVAPDALSRELSDMQLRLEQERAARATLQTTVEGAQTTIAKLQAELLFLRNHGAGSR
ncbi:hypothetical protein LMG27952_03878 [Paraburkholderia hiiakae]|uniref:Uncharacterized protein n=1 Tax=Paraburkholderia hiiakae TaxID=1081782 RepID=A0ABM8NT27_9BURK|nr:hypothetical protein [Paraburkholderia hiiakae]CAD6542128.1 hypothetical protein LMG27952_03878 [Paraburkholderia hiiakae]